MTLVTTHSIISAKNLSVGYKIKKRIITVSKEINLELSRGKLVCVLGKNGIGKSTLLRTLTKIQPKLAGEIIIDGQHLDTISNIELAKKMSLVLTEKIPENNLTAYELIALGRQPYTNWIDTLTELDLQHIQHAIKLTSIEDLIHKKHYELSDGQLQKVMIARSLAQNTEIITLDEPTIHLDIQSKIEIFKLLKKLTFELQKTIIVSTHEIPLALQLADELVLMYEHGITKGSTDKLIENGSISNLFDNNHIKFDLNSKQFLINEL